MEKLLIGLYVISALALIASVAALVLFLRRKKSGEKVDGNVKEQFDEALRPYASEIKDSVVNTVKLENAMVTGAIDTLHKNYEALNRSLDELKSGLIDKFNALKIEVLQNEKEQNKTFNDAIEALKTSISANLEAVRASNEKTIESLRRSNEEQLKQMREVVDEKLATTLESRFTQSFKIVGDRLEEINRSFAELQGLQSSVGDLNKILSNVKTRGGWGEVLLENLLSQILTPAQYEKQKQLKRGSREMVDFAIRLPGKGDGTVYLPIDSKFPIEDYRRLQAAEDEGNVAAIEDARKALYRRIKSEAMSIRDKYVNPPTTTDFAVMYLPIEGLYAEVLRDTTLVEAVQRDYRIVICGPTTLAALLNSLQLGFRTLAVEKKSQQIAKSLKRFETEFDKFLELLRKSSDKIGAVQKSIGEAEKRADKIKQTLSNISAPEDDTDKLEDVFDASISDEAASDAE